MFLFLQRLAGIVMCGAAMSVHAAGDVGIVDRLSGNVVVVSGSGNRFAGTPFMKVREGDQLLLAQGSEVQVVYFDIRRRELWKGLSSFKATLSGSSPVSGQPTEVRETKGVPARESLSHVGNVQRIGGLTLRSAQPSAVDDDTLAKAQSDYLSWTAAADADDILPELSMLGLLSGRNLPQLTAIYLQALQRKQPGRKDVNDLIELYQRPAR